jgi:hypothetical protein
MFARFDHRPMLTAALALATIVLLVVVVTLSTLLITAAPPTAPALSGSVGNNPPVIGAGGEHYGDDWSNYGHDFDQPKPAQAGNDGNAQAGLGPGSPATYDAMNGNDPIERHAEVVARSGGGPRR